jgi:zinc-ribbon domain
VYCPNCGKENLDSQKFCRSCGVKLQMISQVLASELSGVKADDGSAEIAGRGQKGWQHPLTYGLLIIALGIIIEIFGRKMFADQAIVDIGTVIALLGVGLIGLKGVLLVVSQSRQLPQSKTMPPGVPTNELPPVQPPLTLHPGESPGITEHTTRNLEPTLSKQPESHE